MSRGPFALSLLPTACLLFARLSPAVAQEEPMAQIVSVSGAPQVRRAGTSRLEALFRGTPLFPGDILLTEGRETVQLLFADGSPMIVRPGTVLELLPSGSHPQSRHGSFSIDHDPFAKLLPAEGVPGSGSAAPVSYPVDPVSVLLSGGCRLQLGNRVTVQSLSARAGRKGRKTELEVQVKNGVTTLYVIEGEGRLESLTGGEVTVREGEQSTVEPGKPPTDPQPTDNLPFPFDWSHDVQPVALLVETPFAGQEPKQLTAARQELETRRDRLGPVASLQRAELDSSLGQTWLELGDLTEAAAAFDRSLSLDPDNIAARMGRVMVLLSRRESEAALEQAEIMVKRAPRSPVAHTMLALARIRKGVREDAEKALDQALTLDPNYAQARAWRSFLLRAAEHVKEAVTEARASVALAPTSSLAWQSLADALFAVEGRRETAEAVKAAQAAVRLNPLSSGARVSRARALLRAGNLKGAEQAASQAVALDPGLARARYLLGVTLAQQQRLRPAVRELQRAAEADPGYLEARVFLARVYLEQGKGTEAIRLVQEAKEQDPEFAPARAALGQVYWRAGKERLKDAVQEYREALILDPRNATYHRELARVYLDLNDLPSALEHALNAVHAAPGASETHAVLGIVYVRMGSLEQARREYREALSLSPDSALARLGLATSTPSAGERIREVRRLVGGSAAVEVIAADTSDSLGEVAQALLRDPSVLPRIFEPGIVGEVAPSVGRHETVGLGFTHRDLYSAGRLHDLSFASREASANYRNDRPESRTLAWLNLAAAPQSRTRLLGQYLYLGRKRALPGATLQPTPEDRSSFWETAGDLAARHQVNPTTFLWLRAALRRSVSLDEVVRPDEDRFAISPTAFRRTPLQESALEGRLNHRWGRQHTTSYVLFAGRNRTKSRELSFNGTTRELDEVRVTVRDSVVAHTLQHDYRPNARLSLILGVTAERFTDRFVIEDATSDPPTDRSNNQKDETRGLPYGQLTCLPSPRDLVRVIAHQRTARGFTPLLQPAEAFLVAEIPPFQESSRFTTYELDYERRLSAKAFAKLFFFHSDLRNYFLSPAVKQTLNSIGFFMTDARARGIGVRFERQIEPFLSGYLGYTYREFTDQTEPGGNPDAPRPGRQIPLNPRSRAVLGVNYVDRAGRKLLLEATWSDGLFVGGRRTDLRDDNGALVPSWRRVPGRLEANLRFGMEPSVRREWVFSITNLFNTATVYWRSFLADGSVQDFPGPGRTYRLQYFLRF